jgi:hypothetical protein
MYRKYTSANNILKKAFLYRELFKWYENLHILLVLCNFMDSITVLSITWLRKHSRRLRVVAFNCQASSLSCSHRISKIPVKYTLQLFFLADYYQSINQPYQLSTPYRKYSASICTAIHRLTIFYLQSITVTIVQLHTQAIQRVLMSTIILQLVNSRHLLRTAFPNYRYHCELLTLILLSSSTPVLHYSRPILIR